MAKNSPGVKGNGSVFYVESRDRYRVKVPVGKFANGSTRYVERQAKTKKAAEDLRRKLLNQRDENLLAVGPRQTFKDFALTYLRVDASSGCKQTTIDDYHYKLEHWVFAVFGHQPIQSITSLQIADFLVELRTSCSTKTVNTIRGLLSSVFTAAERHGVVRDNPVKRTQPIRQDPFEPTQKQPPWTVEEILQVLEFEPGTQIHAFISFALATGLRLGEILALQWSHVDLVQGTVYVERTLRYTTEIWPDGHREAKLVFNTPKTPDSHRFIQIQGGTMDVLSLLKTSQELAGHLSDDGLVFSHPDGRPINPSTMRNRYTRHLKKFDMRFIRVHDCRHSFSESLIVAGVSLQQLQQALGHRSIITTKNTYGANIPALGQQATEQMAKLMYPDTPTIPPVVLPKKVDAARAKSSRRANR